MINYADYNFYSGTYKGSLSTDLFNFLIIKASREIDRNINCRLTQNKINSMNSTDQYMLKYVACELVDYFNTNGSNSSDGKASSISIDGVSINKGTKTAEQIEAKKENILNNLPIELVRYL